MHGAEILMVDSSELTGRQQVNDAFVVVTREQIQVFM